MNGKRYDKDFKIYAVKMVVEDGRKVAEVARELDLVHQTLHKWVDKYKEEQEDATRNHMVGNNNCVPITMTHDELAQSSPNVFPLFIRKGAVLKVVWMNKNWGICSLSAGVSQFPLIYVEKGLFRQLLN
ncbi:transposase [Bacillus sp. WMMC1349]|uniref:transposase n=1 Tax=Bacillus sp. WMMC1349 TaxID=2736254 RepID=UPI0015560235|nr:transposase [Bacillus sp. WMMC1349]NPC93058.1 transposase [Bacillus sp. WMMC1349]